MPVLGGEDVFALEKRSWKGMGGSGNRGRTARWNKGI